MFLIYIKSGSYISSFFGIRLGLSVIQTGRCNFHHIAFPDPDMMRKIIDAHFPDIDSDLAGNAIETFYGLREIDNIEKKPATRELINWIRALNADPDFKPKQLEKGDVPFLGVLFKKSQDYERASNIHHRRGLI